MKFIKKHSIPFNKVLYLVLLLFVSSTISAQKYKKLYESNDLEKLSEKIEKALRKDSSDLLLFYYKSKYLVKLDPPNYDLAYQLISRVCNDFDSKLSNNEKKEYLDDDFTYANANNLKQTVCALILDSIELNLNTRLSGYKYFNSNYKCENYKIVKLKIDTLEFNILARDSIISDCEKYLGNNSENSFKNEILSIIEFKTFQNLKLNDFGENNTLEFKRKFPKSVFLPEILYHEMKRKIENAILANDTNSLNTIVIAISNTNQINYKQDLQSSINTAQENIYYKICEEKKDITCINKFLFSFNNSNFYNRVFFIKDSLVKVNDAKNLRKDEENEYPVLVTNNENLNYYKDYYNFNIINAIPFNKSRKFKNGFTSISRQSNLLFDGNEKWTFMDKKGRILTDFIYDETHSFSEDLAAVKKDGLWGFIDTSGKQVIDFKYSSVKDFQHGLAVVVNFSGAYYYIDKKGNQYGDGYFVAFPFCNNKRAIIKESDNGSYHLIDRNFNKYEEPGGKVMYDVSNKLTFVNFEGINLVDSNNNNVNWKLNITNEYNCKGENIISFPCTDKESIDVFPLNNNDYFLIGTAFNDCGNNGIYTPGESPIYACIFNNEGKKIIDNLILSSKDVKIKNNYVYISEVTDNYNKSLGGYGVVYDFKNGRVFNDKNYYRYGEFRDGFCVVVKSSSNGIYDDGLKYGFIDVNGKLLGNTINYDLVTSFNNGFAIVNQNKKSGIINTKSELIGNKVWDNVNFYSKNYFVCTQNGKKVITDTTGTEVSQYFDEIGLLIEGYAIVSLNGNLSFIDEKGKLAFKLFFPFESLMPFHNGLAPARYLNKWGFIDKTGKFIIAPKYLDFFQFMVVEGYALVRGEDKVIKINGYPRWESNYFIIDKNGLKVKDVIYKN